MRQKSFRRLGGVVAGTAAAALILSGCVASERGDEAPEGEASSEVDSTFVFAASSDPASLDPAFAQDGESFRVSRNVFEGLIGVKAGTADPAPLLAEDWGSPAGMDDLTYIRIGIEQVSIRYA